jgi:hypothetical protein
MRKWLINWVAAQHWLPQELAQRGETETSAKEAWVFFVTNAREHEVAEMWLRIALLARHAEYAYLGSGGAMRSLLPPDQDVSYEGNLFRNEWEAQWACFFTCMHLPFQYVRGTHYEPFDLPASTAFWLETLSCFQTGIVVTGDEDQASLSKDLSIRGAYCIVTSPHSALFEPERREQACRFAQHTGKVVYILEGRIGLPSHWDGSNICLLAGEKILQPLHWYECLSCGAIGGFDPLFPTLRFCQCQGDCYQDTTNRLVKAYIAARYAHFEEEQLLQLTTPGS